MDDRLKAWRPTKEEVDRIRLEIRPVIRDLARRDEAEMKRAVFLRRIAQFA